jgi:hypothetical protein
MRSNPVWSPDSQQIAWLEFEPVTTRLSGQVVVHDRATEANRIWATGLGMGFFDGGIIHIPNLDGWGSHIAQTVWTYGIPEDFAPGIYSEDAGYMTAFIDEDGVGRREPVSITLANIHDYVADAWFWVRQGDAWRYAIHYASGWQLLNPLSGERIPLSQPPLLQIPGGGGLRLQQQDRRWSVVQPDGQIIALPEGVKDAALAPDGQAVAYLDGTTVYLWRAGQAVEPLLPENLTDWKILSLEWSPSIWVAGS